VATQGVRATSRESEPLRGSMWLSADRGPRIFKKTKVHLDPALCHGMKLARSAHGLLALRLSSQRGF